MSVSSNDYVIKAGVTGSQTEIIGQLDGTITVGGVNPDITNKANGGAIKQLGCSVGKQVVFAGTFTQINDSAINALKALVESGEEGDFVVCGLYDEEWSGKFTLGSRSDSAPLNGAATMAVTFSSSGGYAWIPPTDPVQGFSMHFKLFYKQYDYKPSLSAIKQFKEATGKDLWSSLIAYMGCYIRCTHKDSGMDVTQLLVELSKVLDFSDSAELFYAIGKQSNSALTIEEIEDGMYHAGIFPNIKETDKCEPYPFVMYQVALEVQKYHNSLAAKKKP